MQAAQEPKALDGKTTELMALAIAIAQRCEGCVVYHAKQSFKKGAARDEILDNKFIASR